MRAMGVHERTDRRLRMRLEVGLLVDVFDKLKKGWYRSLSERRAKD